MYNACIMELNKLTISQETSVLAFVFECHCWEAASLTAVFVSQAFVVVFIYFVF